MTTLDAQVAFAHGAKTAWSLDFPAKLGADEPSMKVGDLKNNYLYRLGGWES